MPPTHPRRTNEQDEPTAPQPSTSQPQSTAADGFTSPLVTICDYMLERESVTVEEMSTHLENSGTLMTRLGVSVMQHVADWFLDLDGTFRKAGRATAETTSSDTNTEPRIQEAKRYRWALIRGAGHSFDSATMRALLLTFQVGGLKPDVIHINFFARVPGVTGERGVTVAGAHHRDFSAIEYRQHIEVTNAHDALLPYPTGTCLIVNPEPSRTSQGPMLSGREGRELLDILGQLSAFVQLNNKPRIPIAFTIDGYDGLTTNIGTLVDIWQQHPGIEFHLAIVTDSQQVMAADAGRCRSGGAFSWHHHRLDVLAEVYLSNTVPQPHDAERHAAGRYLLILLCIKVWEDSLRYDANDAQHRVAEACTAS